MIVDKWALMRLASGRQNIARARASRMGVPLRVEMDSRHGGFVLVHRSTKRAGWWQATFFNESNDPWMDTEGADFGVLVMRLTGYGLDWRTARAAVVRCDGCDACRYWHEMAEHCTNGAPKEL